MNKKPAANGKKTPAMGGRKEGSMGRTAARRRSVEKGATPGEANRAQNVTAGEKRGNKENAMKRAKAKPAKMPTASRKMSK